MSEEAELAGMVSSDVISALVEKSGIVDVPREYSIYIAARVYLRHQVALVWRTIAAAEKITASGLAPQAFSALDEPLLTAILEGAAEEMDPWLQQAWENLLANVVTSGGADVRRAFPKILAELEPAEVRLLDALAPESARWPDSSTRDIVQPGSETAGLFDNLERLGLVRYEPGVQDRARVYASIGELAGAMRERCNVTSLGKALITACRPPRRADSEPSPKPLRMGLPRI